MEETTYMSERGFLVTNARVEIGGQTFAVRNIGSVKVTKKGANVLSLVLVLAGVAMLFNAAVGVRVLGTLVVVASAWWLWAGLTRRTLVLVTGGGEVAAYTSRNRKLIEVARAAIASAISAR